ncbi:hypothetical protein PsYK624_113940 [Phanerochaete sordida]|uniref:Uncharacterized protein n=1 Tax=Phanerochaete sordida TaxID=48140 RepID=A0A9P3GHW5_9APHY|nr:hypothetical protein PsYK624_113940 [Phanerochaete sordida]
MSNPQTSPTSPNAPTIDSLLAELDRLRLEDDVPGLKRVLASEDEITEASHHDSDLALRSDPVLQALRIGDASSFTQIPCLMVLEKVCKEAKVQAWLSLDTSDVGKISKKSKRAANALYKLCKAILDQGYSASFKEIRRLYFLRRNEPITPAQATAEEQAEATNIKAMDQQLTIDAWKTLLVGDYHKLAYKSILDMKSDAPSHEAYHNVLPIIQSSGTGKSRMADELSGLIFTLPLTMHQASTDGFVYPPPDTNVVEYLVDTRNENDARLRHMRFLYSLVQVASELLKTMNPNEPPYDSLGALALAWKTYLEEKVGPITRRTQLYDEAIKRAPTFVKGFGTVKEAFLTCQTKDSLESLIKAIKSRLESAAKKDLPSVLILFTVDEVDGLSQVDMKRSKVSNDAPLTAYDIFLSSLQGFDLSLPYFVLTLSTHSRLDKHAPARRHHTSGRGGSRDAIHQAPWTELPFDCHPKDKPLYTHGELTIDGAAKPSFMARFGRPMFFSRLEALRAMEISAETVEESLVQLAFLKVTGYGDAGLRRVLSSPNSDMSSRYQLTLAIAAMRVLLEFDISREPARDLAQDLVARHMLIVYSVPKHREYMRMGAPSEPLLAHIAAQVMNEYTEIDVVGALASAMKAGQIDKGQRGELVGRLLMILAHDKATRVCRPVRTSAAVQSQAINWSEKVPVLTFLQALFAEEHHATIAGCTPDNIRNNLVTLEEAFRGAFVRFSHYVRLGQNNMIDPHVGAAALARGMAFQCNHTQPEYDMVIPVLMPSKDADPTMHADNVTFIIVQVKSRSQSTHIEVEAKRYMLPRPQPYIVISMQLGVQNKADLRGFAQDDGNTAKSKKPAGKKGDDEDSEEDIDEELEPYYEDSEAEVEGVAVAPATSDKAQQKGKAQEKNKPRAISKPAAGVTARLPSSGVTTRTAVKEIAAAANKSARYALDAKGCSSAVYGVITPEQEASYASLLASRGVLAEHARQKREILDCVRRMKLEWVRNEPCFDWVEDDGLSVASTEGK